VFDLDTHATPNSRKASMRSEEKMMETEIVRLHREGKRAESLRQFAGGKRVRGFRSRDRRRSHVRVYLAVPQCERKGRRSRIDIGFCLSYPSHDTRFNEPAAGPSVMLGRTAIPPASVDHAADVIAGL
jgi:hypothetical protein